MQTNGQVLLDTLGQSRTSKMPVLLAGKGSDLNNDKALKGRAKRKIITQSLVLALIDIAKERGDIEKIQPFWNTYYCQDRVFSSDGRLYGQYCKNRICTLCGSIRKAEIINKYLPIIESWENPQFLTLTIKAVKARNLKKLIAGMVKAFGQIKDAQRKRHQRRKGIQLIGIKSLECNFNPVRKTYNPHLHLILPNIETSELLINEWLKKWTPNWTSRKAQLNKPVFNNETALIEIIKYGSKIFTEPDINKKSRQKMPRQIYAAALYNILDAMKGHHLFDRFGFNLPKYQKPNTCKQNLTRDYKEWLFDPAQLDWQNIRNNEVLTEYQPTYSLTYLLKNNIDTVLQ
jgi:hypothetical protein